MPRHAAPRTRSTRRSPSAEAAYRAELARVTIADLVHGLAETVSPVAVRKSASWFQEVLR